MSGGIGRCSFSINNNNNNNNMMLLKAFIFSAINKLLWQLASNWGNSAIFWSRRARQVCFPLSRVE